MSNPPQFGDTAPDHSGEQTDLQHLRDQQLYNRRVRVEEARAARQQSQETFARVRQQGGVLEEIYDGRGGAH